MREMKDSRVEWIGEIPKDWKIVRLKYLYKRANVGESIDKDYCNDEGIGYVFYTAGFNPQNTTYEEFPSWKYTRDFDVLLARNGTPYVYLPVEGSAYSDHIIRIGIKPFVDKRFVRYALQRAIEAIVVETVSISTWSISLWREQYLPYPDYGRQCEIADYLDKKCSLIDEVIRKQEKIIEKLKEYKLSIITEAVTKGLNSDVELKDSGVEWIGKVPLNWNVEKLKYATFIMRGKFNHRPRNDPDYYDGEYPFVQTGDVAQSCKYIISYSQTLNDKGYSVSKEFPKGSICMTIAANVGDVAILGFDACFPDSVVGFLPNNDIELEYLYYVLKAMKQQLTRNAIISTQLNLNVEIVKEELIPYPKYDEQKRISMYLIKTDECIDRIINKRIVLVKKLQQYKKSLIYEVVTGKKEI